MADKAAAKDKSKVHKLALKGSAKLVAEFFQYSIHTILFQRGVYPAEDFTAVKKYGLNMLVSADDQVKAYIKKIMSQLDKWMQHGKISKLVIVVTDKDTGEHVERWQFDVQIFGNVKKSSKSKSKEDAAGDENVDGAAKGSTVPDTNKTEAEIQAEIAALFRQITASVTFLPQLQGDCTFNVLVYADADSDVPVEWGDSDAKEIVNGEKVQLRGFSTSNHRVETLFPALSQMPKQNFEDEFERLACSPDWVPGTQEYRRERTKAIGSELKYWYFSQQAECDTEDSSDDGSAGVDEDGEVKNDTEPSEDDEDERETRRKKLTREEIDLRGFHALCCEVGIEPRETRLECERILKSTLVNIVDLIDTRRT
ncbi:putative Mitotic spindle checkpoint component mad2 [Seiridium unicorne]|uniref:Mitotic spindle checkpoint component mad2 n=1 Tax=Seiridium unicorne TaxID=138068 RepID=A0ABR2VFC5_9PEZI